MAELTEQMLRLMGLYVGARLEQFGGHALHELMRGVRASFANLHAIRTRPSLKVKAGLGQGNWAVVPWVAVLDSRETATTQNGVYVILLFRADMSGVYLTLNQGITLPSQRLGRGPARTALRSRAEAIRTRFPDLASLGFDVNPCLDLKAPRHFSAGYQDSTIASRLFVQTDIARGSDLYEALADVVGVYDEYLTSPISMHLPRVSQR